MDKPIISVILGSYNQKSILKRVLDSYQRQSLNHPFELIVVDSTSDDGSQELLSRYAAKYILRPIIQENKGKAAARNRGVLEAQSELIIVTDSDMIADKYLIETHVRAHMQSDRLSCFEGRTMNMTQLHWPPEPEFLKPYISRNYRNGAGLGWYYFLTGNISFPKQVFVDAGGFSTEFKQYGWEDLELGYRMRKRRVPLYYLKHAINYHYHVLTQEEEIQRCYFKGESAAIFYTLHPKVKWFLGLNPLSVWFFKRLNKEGRIYRMFQSFMSAKSGRRQRIGFWFLKEYEYMKGLLQATFTD